MEETYAIAAVISILIVVVGSVVGSVMNARLRAQRGLRKDWLGNEIPIERRPGEDEARQREVEELRERVRVLERIATDKRVQLADAIEDLRGEKAD
jgi:hypothetical protein